MSNPRMATVVCMGDSLTRSMRSSPRERLVAVLERNLQEHLGDDWRINCVSAGGEPAINALPPALQDQLREFLAAECQRVEQDG